MTLSVGGTRETHTPLSLSHTHTHTAAETVLMSVVNRDLRQRTLVLQRRDINNADLQELRASPTAEDYMCSDVRLVIHISHVANTAFTLKLTHRRHFCVCVDREHVVVEHLRLGHFKSTERERKKAQVCVCVCVCSGADH